MSTIFNNLFSINGVLDTGNSVLQNMNEIASACGSWITYDINQGKWAVVINQAGSSIASFDDSNILGGISISSTSLTEVYNAVEIEFPHKDLRDQKDYVKLSIPLVDRYPNEPDNVLSIKTELINDPIQAELIAARELKQSRVDRVIQFRTDYTTMELTAGDLIDVTNTIYGFTAKVFRIIKIDEEDADDGTIIFNITALEYNADIYSTAGLVRQERTTNNGIVSKSVNSTLQANESSATTTSVANSLLDPTNAALIALLMNSLTRSGNSSAFDGAVGVAPTVFTFKTSFLSAAVTTGVGTSMGLGYYKYVPLSGEYKIKYNINWGGGANGGAGPNGAFKTSAISYSINGGAPEVNGDSATGDANVQIYEDHIIEGTLYLNQGDRIDFGFEYGTNWPTAVFLVNAELILIQRV